MTEPKKPEDEAPETDAAEQQTDTETDQDTAAASDEVEETSEHADDTGSDTIEAADDDTQADPDAETDETEAAEDPEVAAEAAAEGDTPENVTEDTHEPDDTERPDQTDTSDLDADAYARGETDAVEADPEPDPDPDPDPEPDIAPVPEPEPVASVAPSSAAPAETKVVETKVVEKRGGVIPGFIGGVIAVAGAVFAAPYVLPENMRPVTDLAPVEGEIASLSSETSTALSALTDETSGALSALTERIDGLATTLEGTATPDDVSSAAEAVRSAAAAASDDLAGRLEGVSAALDEAAARVGSLEDRLTLLEKRPFEDSADPAVVAAMQAYEREIADLRAAVETQTAENQRLADEQMAAAQALVEGQTEEARRIMQEAAAATEAARADVEAQAAAAKAAAEAAQRQKAIADIRAALEAGAPFDGPLETLGSPPDALGAVSGSGVVTLAVLQEEMPELARTALAAARDAQAAAEGSGDTRSFLQKQLGLRSLTPRDGDDPDAVLSRIEAATQAGDISVALVEIDAMPDPAKAVLSDWVSRATARIDALAAIEDLAAQMATN